MKLYFVENENATNISFTHYLNLSDDDTLALPKRVERKLMHEIDNLTEAESEMSDCEIYDKVISGIYDEIYNLHNNVNTGYSYNEITHLLYSAHNRLADWGLYIPNYYQPLS